MEASEPIRHPDALNEHGEMSDFPESVMFTSSLCPSPCRTGRDTGRHRCCTQDFLTVRKSYPSISC